jgi:hypothetical protein
MVMPPAETNERLARINLMIEEFRAAKERQILRRLGRKVLAEQQREHREDPPERVH